MSRPSRARLRWRTLGCALILIAMCFNGWIGCSSRKSSVPPPLATESDVAAVGQEEDAAADDAREPTETCEGVLDCTFFGLGALLAAPFWVLGAVLGLAF